MGNKFKLSKKKKKLKIQGKNCDGLVQKRSSSNLNPTPRKKQMRLKSEEFVEQLKAGVALAERIDAELQDLPIDRNNLIVDTNNSGNNGGGSIHWKKLHMMTYDKTEKQPPPPPQEESTTVDYDNTLIFNWEEKEELSELEIRLQWYSSLDQTIQSEDDERMEVNDREGPIKVRKDLFENESEPDDPIIPMPQCHVPIVEEESQTKINDLPLPEITYKSWNIEQKQQSSLWNSSIAPAFTNPPADYVHRPLHPSEMLRYRKRKSNHSKKKAFNVQQLKETEKKSTIMRPIQPRNLIVSRPEPSMLEKSLRMTHPKVPNLYLFETGGLIQLAKQIPNPLNSLPKHFPLVPLSLFNRQHQPQMEFNLNNLIKKNQTAPTHQTTTSLPKSTIPNSEIEVS